MIVQIDVNPETAALIAEAQNRGVSVDAWLREALLRHPDSDTTGAESLSPEEWETTLQEVVDSPSFARALPLPDEAFSRENIYSLEKNDAAY